MTFIAEEGHIAINLATPAKEATVEFYDAVITCLIILIFFKALPGA